MSKFVELLLMAMVIGSISVVVPLHMCQIQIIQNVSKNVKLLLAVIILFFYMILMIM